MDYKAAWRERTRHWAVMLLGGCCVACGSTDDPQFDHVDAATKSFEISVGIRDGFSRAKLEKELVKCQLLCRPCHIGKSIESMDGGRVEHGGGKSGKLNCKCEACKSRKREYMRDYMRQKRAALAQW